MVKLDSVLANASAYSPRPNCSSHSPMSRAISASLRAETVPSLKGIRGSIHRRYKPRECRLWVRLGLYRQPRHRCAHLQEAEENDAKADVPFEMSAVGGRADLPRTWPDSLLVAISGSAGHLKQTAATRSNQWCGDHGWRGAPLQPRGCG